MSSQSPSKAQLWGGRVVSGLVILGLTMSAAMKLSHGAEMVSQFVSKFGYPEQTLRPIGVVELLCVTLYAIPKTSVLGAVLLTGYLAGAVATHVRVSDPFVTPLVLGVLVWVGLFLRDPRIRSFLPLRSSTA